MTTTSATARQAGGACPHCYHPPVAYTPTYVYTHTTRLGLAGQLLRRQNLFQVHTWSWYLTCVWSANSPLPTYLDIDLSETVGTTCEKVPSQVSAEIFTSLDGKTSQDDTYDKSKVSWIVKLALLPAWACALTTSPRLGFMPLSVDRCSHRHQFILLNSNPFVAIRGF